METEVYALPCWLLTLLYVGASWACVHVDWFAREIKAAANSPIRVEWAKHTAMLVGTAPTWHWQKEQ